MVQPELFPQAALKRQTTVVAMQSFMDSARDLTVELDQFASKLSHLAIYCFALAALCFLQCFYLGLSICLRRACRSLCAPVCLGRFSRRSLALAFTALSPPASTSRCSGSGKVAPSAAAETDASPCSTACTSSGAPRSSTLAALATV